MMTRADVRAKRKYQYVWDKLSKNHFEGIDAQEVWDSLATTRAHIHGTYNHQCLDVWIKIISSKDLPLLNKLYVEDTDWTLQMRKLSPLNVLIDEATRLEIIRHLDDHTSNSD